MFFEKFVVESENGVLVLYLKNGFDSFVLLELRPQIRHDFGVFCRKWIANSPIFGHEKFTALRLLFTLYTKDVVSVSTSRSRDAPTSCLGLGYLRLEPETLFCSNFASHINKMSQISSRYNDSVN